MTEIGGRFLQVGAYRFPQVGAFWSRYLRSRLRAQLVDEVEAVKRTAEGGREGDEVLELGRFARRWKRPAAIKAERAEELTA